MIKPFLEEIKSSLENRGMGSIFLSNDVRVYWNDQGNTLFGALPVDLGVSPTILQLIKLVDQVMEKFDLEKFYVPPDPHVSLVYGIGHPNDIVRGPTTIGTIDMPDDDLENLRIDYTQIHIRIGKDVFQI
jgi:hypothetical protein